MFELPPKITKDFLLAKNTQEAYFEFYLGVPVKKGLFTSPSCLRKDKRPTCAFYKNTKGSLIFKDFAGVSGDFVNIVMELYNTNYYKALNIIANDFGYIKLKNYETHVAKKEYSGNILKETSKAVILVEVQNFSKKELLWWDSFGISLKILNKFKVYSIKHIFLNGNYFNSSSPTSPIYGYYGGVNINGIELWRLYMPTKHKYRFLSNWDSVHWQGSKLLPKQGDHCIITKSMKDVMMLYEFGIISIAPTSENVIISKAQFYKIKTKYNNIMLFYDNDLPGVKAANKYKKKYGIKCIFIKRKYAKDISDLYKKVSSTVFWTIIEELELIKKDNTIKKTKHFYIF